MAVDIDREIRRAVDTGEVVFGSRQTEKSITRGDAQMVIVVSNAPKEIEQKIKCLVSSLEVPLYGYGGTGLQLGSACGKPFVVSVMAVEKAGKSKVLDVLKGKTGKGEK